MGRPRLAVGTAGEFTYTKTDDGWKARVWVRDGDGRRRDVVRLGATKEKAKQRLKDALVDRPTLAVSDSTLNAETSVSALAERWLSDINASTKAHGTKRLYRLSVENHILPALGGVLLRELTVPRADAMLRAVQANSGPGMAKTVRAALSGMVSLAVRHGAMPSNPVRDTGKIEKGDPLAVRALTVEEQERVLDAPRTMKRAVDLDIPDLIDWMLGTGMRIGEACAIRDECLDLEAGTVEVNATVIRIEADDDNEEDEPKYSGLVIQRRAKSDAGWRRLALPPDLVEMLERRKSELRLTPDSVMTVDRTGKIFKELTSPGLVLASPNGHLRDPRNTLRDLREVLDGIDRTEEGESPFAWVHSHVFRKTVATRLDESGFTARQIADVLGHRRPSMTQDVYMGRHVVSAATAIALKRASSTPISELRVAS